MRAHAAGLLRAVGMEPRLVAAFGENYPRDKYGMPIPPRTLPDDSPLLQHTRTTGGKQKATAEIPEDHPLVLKQLLKSGTVKRQDLHNAIIQHFINEAKVLSPGQKPVSYLVGGGGGAGKSTFWGKAKELLGIDPSRAVNINADDIKLFFPEFELIRQKGDYRAAEVVHSESNFIANKLLEKVTNSSEKGIKYDIMLDRTLANQEPSQKLIRNLKQKGYGVHLIGLTIDPYEGMIRAFVRAKKDGRWVPSSDLAKAHSGFNAALKSYIPMVDRADVLDTSSNVVEKIARKKENSPVEIYDARLYKLIHERGK